MINLLTKLFRMAFPLPAESYIGKVIRGTGQCWCGDYMEESLERFTFFFIVLEDDGRGQIGGPVVVQGKNYPDRHRRGIGRKNFYRRNKRWADVVLNAVENGYPQGTVCLNEQGVSGVVATYYCGTFYGTTVSGRRLWTSKAPILVEEKI